MFQVMMAEDNLVTFVSAEKAVMKVDGLLEYVEFLDKDSNIVAMFRLSQIKGFFKAEASEIYPG